MKFFTGIIIIALVAYWYIARRLGLSRPQWLFLFIPFSCLIVWPFFRENYLLANLAFVSMGLISYLFVLTLFRDLLLLFKVPPVKPAIIVLLSFLCAGAGTWKAIHGIETVHVSVPVKELPAELAGLRIVHISDLHIGPTIGRSFVERIVTRINDLSPDLIVFTGDIGDAAVERHLEDSEPLRLLRSKHGSFYAPGNHEVYWKEGEWMDRFSSLGMTTLSNSGKVISHKGKEILIAGVPDPRSGVDWKADEVAKEFAGTVYKILLSHRPEVAEEKTSDAYDLILAGHTHGGQFFPWTIVAWLDHKYFVGLYERGKSFVYVSPGTGSWGPLIRLGSTPEIAVLNLEREK